MRYLAPEIVNSYYVPNLYENVAGFHSPIGKDGDGKGLPFSDDA